MKDIVQQLISDALLQKMLMDFKQCTAKPEDLVDGCMLCESRPADAPFPNNEYCKECVKILEDEWLYE